MGAAIKIIQEDKQSGRLTEQERYGQKSGKAKQSMKKQSVVENLKWLEKILSVGNARERKYILQTVGY